MPDLTPLISRRCPLRLSSPTAVTETESHPGWYAKRSAAWRTGPRRLVRFLLGGRGDGGGELVDDGWLREVLFGHSFEKIGNRFSRRLVGIVRHMGVRSIEALHQLLD